MGRPDTPPPMDYFAASRETAGTRALTIRLGPLELEIGGLDDELYELLHERYTPFSTTRAAAADALRVRLRRDDVEFYLEPSETVELQQVRIACDGDRVRYMSYQVAGWFDVRGGKGELLLAGGRWEPLPRSFENYVRAAVAWQAVGRGGALVHAASAAWRERGYLFYGESGAGKSTLSASNRRGQVLSDDLSLVLPGDDGKLDVVGTPFRGTYEEGPSVQGRYPLSAGFRLIKAERAEVLPVDRTRAFAELVGNLPFVAEAFHARADLFARTLESFAALPLAHLRFAKDDSFWDAIESAGY